MVSSTGSVSETLFALPPSGPRAGGRSGEMGRDEFLRLLVAQLQNQSPLDPQGGAEFVAQMAQFTVVDELIAIKHALQSMARPTTPATPPPATPPNPLTLFR